MNPAEKTIAGHPVLGGRIAKRVGGAQLGRDGGYVIAEVQLVHMHECRAWRMGRRHGPCTCGADAAWQAFAERQGDADPFAGGGAGMITTALSAPTRFEAARLPDGCWTVADLLCGTAVATRRPWDETTANAVKEALNEAPAYAVQFQWAPPHGPGSIKGGGGMGHLCAFCWQPAAPGAWVELRLYDGPGLKIGELSLMVCAGHLAALRPAYERGLVECRLARWEPASDYPLGVLSRRPEERP